MNKHKISIILLILVILSITLTGYALAADKDANNSTNETIANPVNTPADVIEINETANVINITENSNETTVAETIIKEEQKKAASGFSLTDAVISLITAIIIITVIIWGYKTWRDNK